MCPYLELLLKQRAGARVGLARASANAALNRLLLRPVGRLVGGVGDVELERVRVFVGIKDVCEDERFLTGSQVLVAAQ